MHGAVVSILFYSIHWAILFVYPLVAIAVFKVRINALCTASHQLEWKIPMVALSYTALPPLFPDISYTTSGCIQQTRQA